MKPLYNYLVERDFFSPISSEEYWKQEKDRKDKIRQSSQETLADVAKNKGLEVVTDENGDTLALIGKPNSDEVCIAISTSGWQLFGQYYECKPSEHKIPKTWRDKSYTMCRKGQFREACEWVLDQAIKLQKRQKL